MKRSSNQSAAPDWVLRLGMLLCGVGVGLAAYLGFTAPANNSVGLPVTPVSTVAHKLVTKPIEQVGLGERIVGFNPLREQADASEPDPATWRKISLFLTKESGNGLWVDLLRPLEWVEEQQAQPGATIFVDLYEMGAVGDATVLSTAPCPPIEPGSGPVVTGTFKHQADKFSQVVRLYLAGQTEFTTVTSNHPYWSADRQEFVAAGELFPGERVDTALGVTHVVSLAPADHTGYLYNLETTEHVYRIGSLGTLVHNSCHKHHPIPKFLGGDFFQKLTKLDVPVHREFHSLLRDNLKNAGFSLPIGGRTGRTRDWLRYFAANKGSQRKALDAVLDASRSIDAKHGTNTTQDVWNNIVNGRFQVFP